jgi:hypothetical protein
MPVTAEPYPASSGVSLRGNRAMDVLLLLGIFALWIILQVWVLPKLGVPT